MDYKMLKCDFIYLFIYLFVCLFILRPRCTACEILVPQPGTEPSPGSESAES